MRSIFILCFISGIAWSAAVVKGQSATITQDAMNEADIRSGGKRITITLSVVNFVNPFTPSVQQDIINGLSGSAAFELVKANIPLGNVERRKNREARITLPATPEYFISSDDQVTVTVPASALVFYFSSVTATPQVDIQNQNTAVSFSGTLLSGATETILRNGGRTLVITANYNLWRTSLESTDVASVRNMFGVGTFRDKVASQITSGNVTVNKNVMTIVLPSASDYFLGSNESVTINVTGGLFQGVETVSNGQTSFSVSNENPEVILDNTTFQEADIRATNHTFGIVIVGDKLSNPLNVAAIRSGFSGGSGWEAQLENTLEVQRINDFSMNVTIPANGSFNADVTEQVSFTMGSQNLQFTGSGTFADPAHHITIVPITPTLQITSIPSSLNAGNMNGASLIATLSETRLKDLVVSASNLSVTPPLAGLTLNTPVNETYTSFEVPLSFSGSISEGQTLSLVLDGSETQFGSDLTSNALSLSSIYVPVLSAVSIPNQPMGIGDVVTATIFFTANSEPGPFTYVKGTIEGETLNPGSVRKINSSTYTATFTIQEDTPNRLSGQTIRVRGLQFSNLGDVGPAADYDIVQNNDEIDTEVPVVEYISYVDGETHGIGSPVTGIVHADGDNYQFDFSRSSVNHISFSSAQVQVANNNDSTYSVTYTPLEGDDDVPAGSAIPVALVMIDRAGNSNSPPVTKLLNGHSPVIDANKPFLDSAVVVNPGVKVVGDQVEILLYASEALKVPDPPLDGTHVNFVPISSPRVSFRHVSGKIYRLLYTVGAGDNGVGPGQLTYNLEMEDLLGNRSNSNIPLKNNNVTIESALPTATIVGSGAVCEGDSLLAYLYMTGGSPWDVVISDSDGVYATLSGITSPYQIWLKPEKEEIYTVTSVVDGNGISGNTFGQSVVKINAPTPVHILLDRTTYLASEPGVELHADLEPGIFSGPGVAAGYFYPSVATPIGSPHTIAYAFIDLNGCRSHDSIDVEVLEGTGSVYLVSGEDTVSVLCDDAGTYEILGSNKEGIPGTFELRLTNSSTVVPGHILDQDSSDNKAVFNPYGLNGGYDILYFYVIDEVVLTASYFVRVDDIGTLMITSQLPESVCKNDAPIELTGNMDGVDPLATWAFSGPGVSGNMSSGFYYDPRDASADVGVNSITYEYTTEGGCVASTSEEVINNFVPGVFFEINTACVPEEGGVIEFNNLSSGKYAVKQWSWNFGDISSGINNFSNEENPDHFYRDPGQRRINLTATTQEGCVTYHELDTILADQPVVDFTWITDCFMEGMDATFINRSEAPYSAIDTLVWSFKTVQDSLLGEIGVSPGVDTVTFPFTSAGSYRVDLFVLNSGGCSNTLSREIAFKNTVQLGTTGVLEDFNDSQSGWSIHSEDGNESWVWDVPDFEGFDQVAGDKAWYTDLPYGLVGYNEHSWIQSPCYDFTHMKRPLIRVDVMKSFVPNLTGAVLQYQDVIEEGWKTLGLYEDGISWYNSNTIFNRPGDSSFGWGLNVFDPDQEWVTAVHDLDSVAGNPRVKFRFVIATNGGQGIGNQGFAFDNVCFAERTRKSVLEHFTNSGDALSRIADGQVDTFYYENSSDVIDLQYHMDYPGIDPMNLNNPEPASRAGVLGVGQVPYAVLDGGVLPGQRYDFLASGHTPGQEELKMLSLDIPEFLIGMAIDWMENSLRVDVEVVCRTGSYENNIQLYVVVLESEVTAYTGTNKDKSFRNVVLDMLPTPAGKLLGNDWYRGKTESRSYTWEYKQYIEDVEDLGVVAFIQDRETGQILQATTGHLDSQVSAREPRKGIGRLSVYPNPATNHLFVNLGEPASREGKLLLMDLSGKVVLEANVEPGTTVHRLDLSILPQGMYVVCWIESGQMKGRNKLIRTR
jgi:hypothetical protein